LLLFVTIVAVMNLSMLIVVINEDDDDNDAAQLIPVLRE
jgi:mannose/fructose-specific phosphotransferase system component IIA